MRAAAVRHALRLALLLLLGPACMSSGGGTADPEVEAFPVILRSDERPDALSSTVVDARTGRPIPGAVIQGYAEQVDGRAVAVNALLLTMTTDAYGVAVAQVDTQALRASHWIVRAAGYRPFAEYHGFWPPERVDLEPATPVAVRILGPYGDPVAHAAVEGYSGCPHAPPAVQGSTDENGVFRAAGGSPDGFWLWVRAPGCALSCEDLPAAFGDEPCVAVLPPGITIRGRVRDEDGRPLPGVVLRGTNYPRGPAAETDLQGEFVLEGLDSEEGVQVFHPTLSPDTPRAVDRVAQDVPLDLVWTPGGLAPVKESGRLILRARGPDGAAVEDLDLLVLGPDGQGEDGATDADGELVLELAAGRYRVRGDDPFDPFDVTEKEVVVPPAGEVELHLVLSPRPRLQIEGEVPRDVDLSLVAAGREYAWPHGSAEADPPAWLPAAARAAVCVRNHEQGWAHFAPVGPVADGVRTVRLDAPSPHRIRLAEHGAILGAYAVLSPRAHPNVERGLMDIVDGTIPIRWGGRFHLTLRFNDGRSDGVVPLDLPPLAGGAVERQIDLRRDARPVPGSGEARLFVSRADRLPVPELTVSGGRVGAAWSGFHGTSETPVAVWAPSRVLLHAPGLHPLQTEVTHPGAHEVVFAAAGIDLTTVDASGAPVASVVLVNGVLYEAPDGRLSLRGFPAGDQSVVVQRTARSPKIPHGVRWRFDLAEGQVIRKTLRLP